MDTETSSGLYPELPSQESKSKEEGAQTTSYRCTVSAPEVKGEGMYQYISFSIKTTTTSLQVFNVERRYSDFSALRTKLCKLYEGVLVPPLPDKQVIARLTNGRFNGDMLSQRRRGLERFLVRVASHPRLCETKEVEVFLRSDIEEWTALKLDKAVDAAKPVQRSYFDSFRDWTSSVSVSVGAAKPREKTDADLTCDDIKTYLQELEQTMSDVQTKSSSVISSQKALAKSWYELSVSGALLGQYFKKHADQGLSESFSKLCSACDGTSLTIAEEGDSLDQNLKDYIADFKRFATASTALCGRRQAKLVTYNTEANALDARQASVAAASEAQKEALEILYQAQKSKTDRTQQDLEQVTRLMLEEHLKFRKAKETEVSAAITRYARSQIASAKKAQNLWEGILEDLGGDITNVEPDTTAIDIKYTL